MSLSGPLSERTRVRRRAERGRYDRATADAILDEGLVCHVGLATENGPVVIPTLYARDGDRLLLHGSPASRLLRGAAKGAEVCITVTLVDALVLARSAFHHSMNYRSVVVFGRAELIDDPEAKLAAVEHIVETLVPGRRDDVRGPSDIELRGTTVLAVPLDEFSVKVRDYGVLDEPEDMDLPGWAGLIPLRMVAGPPEPDAEQPADRPVPGYVSSYRRGA